MYFCTCSIWTGLNCEWNGEIQLCMDSFVITTLVVYVVLDLSRDGVIFCLFSAFSCDFSGFAPLLSGLFCKIAGRDVSGQKINDEMRDGCGD